MASIYKRKQDKGKKRACWYIGYDDHTGKRRTKKGFTDRAMTERLAAELEENARLIRNGLKPRPRKDGVEAMEDLLSEFEKHLKHRDITAARVQEVIARVRRAMDGCHVRRVTDIDSSSVEAYLSLLRSEGMSKQTSNHYVKALRQFGNWLIKTRRAEINHFNEVPLLNVQTDRRHHRRPLTHEELSRLVAAAEHEKPIESIEGPDRAMMYVLSAWTGYRKAEIGSLTLRSLQLETEQPSVTINAEFSKRRQQETQVLHPSVVERLQEWLAIKKPAPNELLFPVSRKVPGGIERKTAKMMRHDLAAARKIWIEEATSEEEKSVREESDFLAYQSHDGRFADFHANRHTFITNLARAGVSPKTAQTLARHSDIRLTMNVYTHTDLAEKAEAVSRLPGLWERSGSAPKSQNGKMGHSVSADGNGDKKEGDSNESPEVQDISGVDATGPPLSPDVGSTPQRIRTSNLRFRRPVLYPIELGVLGLSDDVFGRLPVSVMSYRNLACVISDVFGKGRGES